ncbi:hypothetical protein WJX72_011710 [[Myrmecia] bisecta]|uniref:Uncharacterized protein n=1 Tax=[Myrmecia] bisecta TaxID=41462 RepID=A0AAW1P7V3_9CHLO
MDMLHSLAQLCGGCDRPSLSGRDMHDPIAALPAVARCYQRRRAQGCGPTKTLQGCRSLQTFVKFQCKAHASWRI